MQSGQNSRSFLSSSEFKPMKRSYSVFPPMTLRCQRNVEVAPVKSKARASTSPSPSVVHFNWTDSVRRLQIRFQRLTAGGHGSVARCLSRWSFLVRRVQLAAPGIPIRSSSARPSGRVENSLTVSPSQKPPKARCSRPKPSARARGRSHDRHRPLPTALLDHRARDEEHGG
jgi:hypothetical protein